MLDDFMVKMFHGFPKPQNKFIRDMVYGIQATGDTIITDIARAVAPEDKHRNVENRLSRNLQAEGLHEKIRDAIQADAVRFIDRNTLVIYDPTDVCKPHSYKMEKLSLVRDASRSSKENVVTTRGYHGCMAVACKSGARKTVPLDLKIWSSLAEGHKGENEEVLDVMRAVDRATDGRGIRVYDRGISHDRRRPEGIGYKGCRRCRDGTSCRTLASDSQRSSEEAGSPASEEARGCKRRRDLRTQPAVLPRQLSPEAEGRAAEGRR